jgi:hypothetical protein
MMIPINSENDHHNRRSKRGYFKIISINGNKPACAGDGVPDTASVKIGYVEQRQPTFWEFSIFRRAVMLRVRIDLSC